MIDENNTTKFLIAGGIVAGVLYLALSQKQPEQNLLKNPGFEEEGVGWTVSQNGTNAAFATEQNLYGNSITITYTTNTGTESASTNQTVPVIGNKSYKLGGKIKTVDVIAPINNGSSIYMRWLDSAGVLISSGQIITAITGTTDWSNYEGMLVSPQNAAFAQVICTLAQSTGRTWFDDIYLIEQK